MNQLNEIFEYGLIVLFLIFDAFIVPYLVQLIDKQKLERVIKWAKIFVQSAEQIYKQGDNESKKEYVMAMLSDKGLREEEAEALLESEVLNLK